VQGEETATGNLIQGNNASGHPGTGIFVDSGAIVDTIRRNAALGNTVFDDIFDAGANSYKDNRLPDGRRRMHNSRDSSADTRA